MNTQTYTIEGMTCNGCVMRVKKGLESLDEVESADIQLKEQKGVLTLNQAVDKSKLQSIIGHYKIEEIVEEPKEVALITEQVNDLPEKSITTYKPLILIVAFITGVTLLAQYPFTEFSGMLWMRHFMAGFFIVFSFFKLLNVEGFANSYQMYDIVAKRFKAWAYLYPFVELALGIMYLINFNPLLTNWITVIVLGISTIGVIQSNLNKQQIKCACLGDVFNLPMSTVTIVEDVAMVGMAAWMLTFL